jgi:hypothetical protein
VVSKPQPSKRPAAAPKPATERESLLGDWEPDQWESGKDLLAAAPSAFDVRPQAVTFAQPGVDIAILSEQLRTPEAIRRAVVLKEILGQPKGLQTL